MRGKLKKEGFRNNSKISLVAISQFPLVPPLDEVEWKSTSLALKTILEKL